ncbi:Oligosaccaryltransferase-domain-containing protein [Thermothelomyces heterothallicus CBS 202.75]|uniref:Oligosaccaryltransferase-domain-containing protein n=1 Tax=Thermothelomyces heterothallicus CBS 202.75 TaxID=1149848 RepID=UPI00374346B3
MITDTELYRLAIVLGSAAMVLIILYHFFEVNSGEEQSEALKEKASRNGAPHNTQGSTKTR